MSEIKDEAGRTVKINDTWRWMLNRSFIPVESNVTVDGEPFLTEGVTIYWDETAETMRSVAFWNNGTWFRATSNVEPNGTI